MPAQNLESTKTNSKPYLHIYNKGVENIKLFGDDADYEVFLSYLQEYLTPAALGDSRKKSFTIKGRVYHGIPHQTKNYYNKVSLIAYSLAPDHFHLVACEITKGSLPSLIRSLSTRYAIYFNKKYKRHGTLFVGPYKSAQVNDITSLLLLTRYLHREANQKSSLEIYLGDRTADWVKHDTVLSYFEASENDYFKGVDGYKNFVEKYDLSQSDEQILESIVIENRHRASKNDLAVPDVDHTPKALPAKTAPRLKTFVYLTTSTAAFFVLIALGLKNITISQAQVDRTVAQLPSPSPQVAGIGSSESPTPFATPQVSEAEPESKTMVVIKITDGSKSVNIRKSATTSSEIVAKAVEGDTFEYVSESQGWYQIKFDDQTAFVSTSVAQIEGEGN